MMRAGAYTMTSKFDISLAKMIQDFKLETIFLPRPAEEIKVSSTEVNRPGLQLAGFFDVFDHHRVQILGKSEITFIHLLEHGTAVERCERLCALRPPVMVVTRSLEVPPVLLDAARHENIPLLRTSDNTCDFMSALISQLNVDLGPRITRHGVLMEIYGDGVLILGDSGVGKSETAIELIARGHRLVADDAVEIRRINAHTLVGTSPENIRHFMELRGIGVINARRMYGMRAVKIAERILMIVQLELWDETKAYDRLGVDNPQMDILGIPIPCVTVPVKPGRNLSVIIEAATMNLRLKKLGYSAPHALMKSLGMPEDDLPPQVMPELHSYWQ